MNKFTRLVALIGLLKRGGRPLHIADISRELGVSERTVYRDIGDINECYQGFFYIQYDDRGYHLSQAAYMPPIHLTDEELGSLRAVAESTAMSTPHGQRVRQAVSKIISVHEETAGQLRLEDRLSVSPTTVRDLVDWKILKRVEDAIRDRAQLRIRYYSFHSRETRSRVVEPYVLTFRKLAWYVVGLSCGHGEVRVFRAGRIQKMARTGRHYDIPSDFSVDEFFRASWDVFTGTPERIELSFSTHIAPLITEVQWHPTQELKAKRDGSVLFSADIPISPEVKSWILSWGSDCEVLEPQSLRKDLAEESQKLRKIYEKTDPP